MAAANPIGTQIGIDTYNAQDAGAKALMGSLPPGYLNLPLEQQKIFMANLAQAMAVLAGQKIAARALVWESVTAAPNTGDGLDRPMPSVCQQFDEAGEHVAFWFKTGPAVRQWGSVGGGGTRLKRTVYSTSGTFNHAFESGTHTALVELIGSGGGGGGAQGGISTSAVGAGGGSGVVASVMLEVNGGSATGTIAAGGAGGSSSGGSGSSGDASWVTINGVAYGASGGYGGSGMPAGSDIAVVGGTAYTGNPGTSAADYKVGCRPGGYGLRASQYLFAAGPGGSSNYGGGGGSYGTEHDGGNGSSLGGGGGGASAASNGKVGGAGGSGGCIITEFLPTASTFAGGSLADEDDYPVTITDGIISGFGKHRKLLVSGTGPLVGIDAPDMTFGSLLLTFVGATVITAMGTPSSGLPIKTPRMGADNPLDIHLLADDVVEVRRRESGFWKVTGGSFT